MATVARLDALGRFGGPDPSSTARRVRLRSRSLPRTRGRTGQRDRCSV